MPAPISQALRTASSSRGFARGSGLRVSDADRNAVAEELARHYGDGRLNAEEFEQRLDHAMSATTYQDLGGLLADLPGQDSPAGLSDRSRGRPRPAQLARPAQAAMPGRPAARRSGRWPGRLAMVIVLLIVAAATVHLISWVAGPVLWACVVLGLALLAVRSRARRQ
jgi:hypothetical protein